MAKRRRTAQSRRLGQLELIQIHIATRFGDYHKYDCDRNCSRSCGSRSVAIIVEVANDRSETEVN